MKNKLDINNLAIDAFTTPEPRCVDTQDSVEEAMDIMESEGIRHLPVKNEKGEIVGMLSHRDLASFQRIQSFSGIKVQDIMSVDIMSVPSGTPLVEASFTMSEKKIGSLIVNDENGKMIGIFTSIDALNALIEVLRGEVL